MISKFSFIIVFAAHWLGMIFFFLARIQPHDSTGKTWLTEYLSDVGLPIGDRNNLEKYVASMYWALTTMTTIGYGDIVPKTTLERFMTTICMIIGAFVFAYGLTNVCTLLFNHNKHQVEFEGYTDELNEYLDRHNCPRPLQQRVHALLWFRHNSSSCEVHLPTSRRTPEPLREFSPGPGLAGLRRAPGDHAEATLAAAPGPGPFGGGRQHLRTPPRDGPVPEPVLGKGVPGRDRAVLER